ncbi:MAG: alpha/beta hydrolase [Betaproteobacteria bacterium]
MSNTTPPEFIERKVWCASAAGLHAMAYTEWGDRDNPQVLICVHGLTRNGRDFDDLARAMSGDYRVICPDVVGRGQSDWLRDPAYYGIKNYVQDMVTLIARLDVGAVHWLGTSMGGVIGMVLASLENTPITRLMLNDVGPEISPDAIRRIGEFLGRPPLFATLDEAERFIRLVSAPFGLLSDAQWRRLTETSLHQRPDGTLEMRYDPRIAESFQRATASSELGLWPIYDRIRCPTQVLRGEKSDLLSLDTVQAMAARGPRAEVVEVPGVGHAPMFMDVSQINLVKAFFTP